MIRRTPAFRALGALFALWLSVFQTEPAALHACKQHSGPGSAPVASAPAMQHAGHAMAAGGMSGMDMSASASNRGPGEHTSHTTCTCPGGCSAASTVAIPEAGAEFSIEVAVPSGVLPVPVVSARVATIAFARPFANGPPSLV